MKKYFNAVESYKANPDTEARQNIDKLMSDAYSKIDKAVKRGVLHGNNGARKKARLAKALKQIDPAPVAS